MVCLDYQGPNSAPSELSFSATIMTSLSGKTVSVTETNVVDNPGSEPVSSSVEIEVESLPYLFSGFLHLPDGTMINLDRIRWLPVVFRLFDPVTGHIVRNAEANYDVTAADGTVVAAAKVRYSRILRLYSFWWRLHGLDPGDYTITAHLDDGTSHSVSVTLFRGG